MDRKKTKKPHKTNVLFSIEVETDIKLSDYCKSNKLYKSRVVDNLLKDFLKNNNNE